MFRHAPDRLLRDWKKNNYWQKNLARLVSPGFPWSKRSTSVWTRLLLFVLQTPHWPGRVTHHRSFTNPAFFPVSNVGQLSYYSGLLRLSLIFQNQGFDRLSKFPKIRDAIIVFTDGCRGFVDLELHRDCLSGALITPPSKELFYI